MHGNILATSDQLRQTRCSSPAMGGNHHWRLRRRHQLRQVASPVLLPALISKRAARTDHRQHTQPDLFHQIGNPVPAGHRPDLIRFCSALRVGYRFDPGRTEALQDLDPVAMGRDQDETRPPLCDGSDVCVRLPASGRGSVEECNRAVWCDCGRPPPLYHLSPPITQLPDFSVTRRFWEEHRGRIERLDRDQISEEAVPQVGTRHRRLHPSPGILGACRWQYNRDDPSGQLR
jgi:hypothetical protein